MTRPKIGQQTSGREMLRGGREPRTPVPPLALLARNKQFMSRVPYPPCCDCVIVPPIDLPWRRAAAACPPSWRRAARRGRCGWPVAGDDERSRAVPRRRCPCAPGADTRHPTTFPRSDEPRHWSQAGDAGRRHRCTCAQVCSRRRRSQFQLPVGTLLRKLPRWLRQL
jgi:hypothetical protein